MKIWQSYGSEHSINLVMIGRFKELSDAEEAKALIDALFDDLNNKVQIETRQDRYSSEVLDLLMSRNISYLSPQELGQFLFDIDVRLEGNEPEDGIDLATPEASPEEILSRPRHRRVRPPTLALIEHTLPL